MNNFKDESETLAALIEERKQMDPEKTKSNRCIF